MKIRKYQYAGKFNRWAVPDYASQLDIKFEPPQTQVGSPVLQGLNTINKQTPSLAQSVASKGGSVLAQKFLGDLSGKFSSSIFGDETDLSRNLGSIFSSGLSSAGNTVFDNVIKGDSFFKGVSQNVGQSVKGAAVGLGANLVGQGITSLGGNSMLSRGIGQGVATGLGEIGGSLLGKGSINPINLGLNVVGSGLSAAFGPSKEYGGKYGNLTKGLDTAYDAVRAVAPPWLSAAMTMNKGLSNLFGSTSGMTRQDAILGSAFMPAPVKWLNMAGANTTNTFKNQSWQNDERAQSFAGNAFGNLFDKFDRAKEEAGKTYGTFSGGAYREARDNIDFANVAWEKLLNMVDQDELQRIRSQYMTSINNQRYAQNIQGGFTPLYRGKQGMKILNNATNHKVGMRLLSGAALIDNKQIILCGAVD